MNVSDDDFGPRLEGSFDFTLLFEQTVMSILPSALLLLSSPWRIASLVSKRTARIKAGLLLWIKLMAIIVLLGLQLANLVLWSASSLQTRASVAAATLSLVDMLAMALLLYAEHRYSKQPSALLTIYLSVTILIDIANVRSLCGRNGMHAVASVAVAAVVIKLILLALEEVPKPPAREASASKEGTGGLWNRSVFWWLNSMFLRGFGNVLEIGDLLVIDDAFASEALLAKLDRAWKKGTSDTSNRRHENAIDVPSDEKRVKHSLTLVTMWAFRGIILAGVIPRLCFTGFSFAQPFLINRIIHFVSEPNNEGRMGVTGGLIGATALIYIGIALSRCHYKHHTFRLITAVRGGLVSLIFKKTLKLKSGAAEESAAVTLMSTDIDGIANGLQNLHELWAAILEMGLGVYLLTRQVGAACFLIVIPAVLSSIASGKVAKGMGPARMAWNKNVQKRVAVTKSVLHQIKGIKMMGLSESVSHSIQSHRVTELESSKGFRILIVWVNMIANLSDQLTPILVIAATVFWTKAGQDLTVAEAFTVLSITVLTSGPLTSLISSYPILMASVGCFDRIQAFLLSTERKDYRSITNLKRMTPTQQLFTGVSNHTSVAVELQSAHENRSASVSKGASRSIITINSASFTLKTGDEPVLQSVNLRIEPSSCTMVIGPVGSGKSTLLKAILGEAKLLSGSISVEHAAMAYCSQVLWLRLASIRDCIIGPNQFDDAWYQSVLHACALNQDLIQLNDGDQSLVGSGGTALSGGQKQRVALARAVYSRAPTILLDDVFSGLDNTTSQTVFTRLLGNGGILRKSGMTVLLATHAVKYLPSADNIIVIDQFGAITQRGTYQKLSLDDGYVKSLAVGKDDVSNHDGEGETVHQKSVEAAKAKSSLQSGSSEQALIRQIGDGSLYKFYLQSVGAWLSIFWLILAGIYIFSGKLPQIWLRIWTERGTSHDTAAYFGGYLGFGLTCALAAGTSVAYFFLIVIPQSAQHLHLLLLQAVMQAPFYFFTTTDSSTILNRFSQDMTLVDQTLPMAAFTTTYDVFNVFAETAIIASGAQYVAAVIPVCFAVLYMLQKFYLRTSRQMRHLDLEAKSPLYRSFTETAAGIVTIRAFNWESGLLSEHLQLLDESQKPYYLLYCIQRWLNVTLDLFVAGFALVLVGFALGFRQTTTSGAIGLAMVNIIGFNQSLSMLINSWTNLETSLGAIARLKRFLAETPEEDRPGEDKKPPANWPMNGSTGMSCVTAKYNISDTESRQALRDVSLDLKSGQKVGVVGRTGSGKSSLILTLLRMLDLESGQITIDGIDISTMQREALRSKIVTIPQDPVELPGTVRHNLDPSSPSAAATDDELTSVLVRVGLWDLILARGGLDAELDTLGLSSGQNQLLSLARAVLAVRRAGRETKGGLVLVDEATSNVDGQTDREMQAIMQEEFAGNTVIVVAHRLETLDDADVVVVLDDGRVAEVQEKDARQWKGNPRGRNMSSTESDARPAPLQVVGAHQGLHQTSLCRLRS